jgi:hypothetical protein
MAWCMGLMSDSGNCEISGKVLFAFFNSGWRDGRRVSAFLFLIISHARRAICFYYRHGDFHYQPQIR